MTNSGIYRWPEKRPVERRLLNTYFSTRHYSIDIACLINFNSVINDLMLIICGTMKILLSLLGLKIFRKQSRTIHITYHEEKRYTISASCHYNFGQLYRADWWEHPIYLYWTYHSLVSWRAQGCLQQLYLNPLPWWTPQSDEGLRPVHLLCSYERCHR